MIRPNDPASPALPNRVSSPQTAHTNAPIDPHDAHHGGMSRRQWWWRKSAMPLLTSLSLHAGIVVIGLLCFTAYKVVSRQAEPTEPVVPESPMQTQTTPIHDTHSLPEISFPQPTPGAVGNPNFLQNTGPIVAPSGPKNAEPDVIDPSWTQSPSRPGQPGTDDVGLPRLSGTMQGIFKPGGPIGGQQTRYPAPTSTAYVCDASGSMMAKMPALKAELSKAVMGLRPWQKFSIIFFQDEKPKLLNPSLILATPGNQHAAESFLDDAMAGGTTDPLPGIKEAFAQHPQIMYLLTDGDFPDNDAVLAEIRQLEKQHHVTIFTIAFTNGSDHDVHFLTLLKQVAQETGGTFKKVDADSLDGN